MGRKDRIGTVAPVGLKDGTNVVVDVSEPTNRVVVVED